MEGQRERVVREGQELRRREKERGREGEKSKWIKIIFIPNSKCNTQYTLLKTYNSYIHNLYNTSYT